MSNSYFAQFVKFHRPLDTRSLRHSINLAFSYLAFAVLAATPAHAEVIEIDAQGDAAFFVGPTLTNDEGASAFLHRGDDVSMATPSTNHIDHVGRAERDYALPKGLIDAVIYQESRGRVNAVSVKGALGLMQLMPGTAAQLGVNPYVVDQNIRGGAMYLKQQIDRFGSIPLGLAAYNAGPGAVLRYRGIPPYRETQNYVASILGRWQPPAQPAVAAANLAPVTVQAVNPEIAFLIEVTDP